MRTKEPKKAQQPKKAKRSPAKKRSASATPKDKTKAETQKRNASSEAPDQNKNPAPRSKSTDPKNDGLKAILNFTDIAQQNLSIIQEKPSQEENSNSQNANTLVAYLKDLEKQDQLVLKRAEEEIKSKDEIIVQLKKDAKKLEANKRKLDRRAVTKDRKRQCGFDFAVKQYKLEQFDDGMYYCCKKEDCSFKYKKRKGQCEQENDSLRVHLCGDFHWPKIKAA
jgi:hypothetical protein